MIPQSQALSSSVIQLRWRFFALVLIVLTAVSFAEAASLDEVDLTKAKRIAIYMGTFDPPHRGHNSIARTALADLNVDYVLVLPVENPVHKPGATPFLHRLRMVQIAFSRDNAIAVPARGDTRGPRDIVRDIKLKNPRVEFLGIVGSDYAASPFMWWLTRFSHKWIGAKITAVILRNADQLEALQRLRSNTVETFVGEVRKESSTQVRSGSFEMVEPEVMEYIKDSLLYPSGLARACEAIF